MHIRSLHLSASIALAMSVPGFAGVKGYYRFPTLHGDLIVFSAEGDLWRVAATGGSAQRLTSDEGVEAFCKLSPDGRILAFSAEYGGNVDVYTMPVEGGPPTRLTFHPTPEEVTCWKPDGSALVFRSRQIDPNYERNLFEVPAAGGSPSLINVGRAALASFSADGRYIAFNRWAGESATWKRYLGGTAQEIWVGDLHTSTFGRMTTWAGSDRFPLWYKDRVFYLSDHGPDNRMNLWSCKPDGSDALQHTKHTEYDCSWPDIDTSTGRIIYANAGDLWIYDINLDSNAVVDISIPTDRLQLRPRFVDASETLDWFALNADGTRLSISSRGEMWNAPARQPGRVIGLTQSSGTRERAPVFSPDGKWIAAITDKSGSQELAIWPADGKGEPRILTSAGAGWIFEPTWSPDGTKIAYSDLTQALFVVDVVTGQRTSIESDAGWEIRQYTFSPDSRWIAYAKPSDYDASTIWIANVADGSRFAVTNAWSNDSSPAWDPEGRYLYFLSSRYVDPILDERDFNHIITKSHLPCLVILAAEGLSPFLPEEVIEQDEKKRSGADEEDTAAEEDRLEAEDDGETDITEKDIEQDDVIDAEDSAGADDADDKESDKPVDVRIDLEGLSQRIVQFPVDPDNYVSLDAISGKVLFASMPTLGMRGGDQGDGSLTLHAYDFESRETSVFIESLNAYDLSDDGSKIAFHSEGGPIMIAGTDTPPDVSAIEETVDPSTLTLRLDPSAEWEQIYWESWRLQRDFYWDENMGGLDWREAGDSYARLLSRAGSRQEVSDIIGNLIGELATSHTYIWGGDTIMGDHVNVGLLGADLAIDPATKAHRFTRILHPESWETNEVSPLTQTNANVKEGDYLWAVNGRELTIADNLWERLAGLAGAQVQLTVGTAPDRSDARDIQIEALEDESRLRYYDWCRRNREYVEAESGGRIGYFHLPDMGTDGLVQFIKGFYPQLDKDGLVVDVRYNGGGFVSQMLIERLARKVWAYDQPRRGAGSTYPYRVFQGYQVCLINESAGSDGDIFPNSFRVRGIGPIIGTRTWGGVIGIRSDKPFVDGGMSTQPEFAYWEPAGGWVIENYGVDPDIEVDILPEQEIAGMDPQLDAALELLQQQLKESPIDRPTPPARPDKTRMNR